jgi:hypothetical protein
LNEDVPTSLDLRGTDKFSRHVVRKPSHLSEVLLHALEAKFVRSLNVVDNDALRHISHELGGIKLVVRAVSLDDLGLFLERKVSVVVRWVNVLDVKVKDFIVGNDSWVGKVVDTGKSSLGHGERGREQLMQYGHGVGDVDDSLILDNLGNEVTMDEIVRDGHAHTKNEAGRIAFEQRFHVSLGLTVERPIKVGLVLLSETDSRSQRVGFIVLEDASSSVNSAVDSLFVTQVDNVQSSEHVSADCLGLVVLAPVNVGASSNTSTHENMGRLDLINLLLNIGAVLETAFGFENFNATCGEEQRVKQ